MPSILYIVEVAPQEAERSIEADEKSFSVERNRPRYFQCLTSDPNAELTAESIYADPRIPKEGTRHPQDYYAICKKIKIKQNEECWELWDITCEYVAKGRWEENEFIENPLDKPPEYTYPPPIKIQRYGPRDATGRLYANSAGDFFEGGFERNLVDLVVQVTRNELAHPRSLQLVYCNRTNSDPWNGAPPNWHYCDEISGARLLENGVWFYKNTYKIVTRIGGWVKYELDQGFRAKNASGVVEDVTNSFGTQSPVQVKLNGSGFKLPSNANPFYVGPFDEFERTPFGPLNLTF